MDSSLEHSLIQDKKAQGSYKSEYHCDSCGQQWGYYDQGDFQRSKKFINEQWPCNGEEKRKTL